MQNFSYHKKYHYALKYFIMAFPLLLLLFSCFVKFNITDSNIQTYLPQLNYSISNFFIQLRDLPLNSWYYNLLDLFGIYTQTYEDLIIVNVLSIYPLYILWVYIMDLILDIFAMIPKLAHKLLYKLGGGIDD